jgi:cytochrome c biogenesis protein CcdA/thiol-disulfide isomerase/thioredoxin
MSFTKAGSNPSEALMVVLLFFSVLSGIVTFLSPCILPILPIVLSSSATNQRARPLGLISGLIVSFSLFTLIIAKIVSYLGLSANALRLLSVVLLIVIGLTMLIPALTVLFDRIVGFLPGLVRTDTRGSGFGQGFLTGASLGLIWAPCAGPILSAVIIVAATQTLTINSALVVFAFSIGVGIPLLAVTYGGRALIQRIHFLSGNLLRIQQIFGVLVILTALLIGFNLDTRITAWATSAIPAGWTAGIDAFENSPVVQQQLAVLRGHGANVFTPTSDVLGNYGPVRDFTGATGWINSVPLTRDGLKGKVYLVDFWTYSCINCIRTFPYLLDWYAKYKDYGFVIIGVHTPEFAFEHDTTNVLQAVQRFGIAYPVAQDNNYVVWNAFLNSYWPAEYLVDAQGQVRHYQYGEGNYDKTEKAIQELLAEAGHPVNAALTNGPSVSFSAGETPETYLGTDRQSGFASSEPVAGGTVSAYTFPGSLALDSFAVSGQWDFEPQYAQETTAGARLTMHFFAQDVYLVMTSDQPATVTVFSLTPNLPNTSEDVDAQGRITVGASRLYHLAHFDKAAEGTIVLEFDSPGVRVFSFTFGG